MVSDPACVEMIWMGAAHGSIRNLRSAVRHKKQYGRAERSHDRDCRDGLALPDSWSGPAASALPNESSSLEGTCEKGLKKDGHYHNEHTA